MTLLPGNLQGDIRQFKGDMGQYLSLTHGAGQLSV